MCVLAYTTSNEYRLECNWNLSLFICLRRNCEATLCVALSTVTSSTASHNQWWGHHQNVQTKSVMVSMYENRILIVMYGSIFSCKKQIMFVQSWRTVHALTRWLSWCVIPLHAWIIIQILCTKSTGHCFNSSGITLLAEQRPGSVNSLQCSFSWRHWLQTALPRTRIATKTGYLT